MTNLIQTARAALLASVLLATSATAGPVTDAEAQLRDAYTAYRTALFQSNAGNAPATQTALDQAVEKWAAISADWTANPPPQYADDSALSGTLDTVGTMLAQARDTVGAGDLTKTHEELEAVRNQIWDLHQRNGVIGFSDRMNAYHLTMEEVLAVDPATLTVNEIPALRDQAAVLSYLAADIAAHPAPEAASNGYSGLASGMQAATQALFDATRAGDVAQVKAAIAALKPAYAKLFANFG